MEPDPSKLFVADAESQHSQNLHVLQTAIFTRRDSDLLLQLCMNTERENICKISLIQLGVTGFGPSILKATVPESTITIAFHW